MNSFLILSLCRRSSDPKMRALMTLRSVTMYGTLSVACISFMITLKRYCCVFTPCGRGRGGKDALGASVQEKNAHEVRRDFVKIHPTQHTHAQSKHRIE